MEQKEGLSSREAINILVEDCNQTVTKWKEANSLSDQKKCFFTSLHATPYPCIFHLTCLFISAFLIAIGAVDLQNEISPYLLLVSFILLVYLLLLLFFLWKCAKQKKHLTLSRVKQLIRYLKNTKDNFGYSPLPEPLTEDMWGQLCLRNGHIVNVPKILLVKGDVILLRPGQIVPCNCISKEGKEFHLGQRIEMPIVTDNRTGGCSELQPIKAMCTESLIISSLYHCLNNSVKPSKLRQQIQKVLHEIESYVFVPYIVVVIITVAVRYIYASSDSYYGTRFVFSIPALIVLPILMPTLPIIIEILHSWNNHSVAESLTVAYEESEKDLLEIFASLTGTSVIDKKGILSSVNPCIDKVIIMKYNEESYLVPDTMNLSSEMQSNGHWKLYFDDPSWQEYLSSLRPIGLNLQLNSCFHNEQYISFLDHMSVVSPFVPRTIVTANRRCMCQFPQLLGFDSSSCLQFLQSEPKTLGFYKRQPGEAPLNGLTKHRTPMEMAFCTVHSDAASSHTHISCQGTADVVLDACTHVWNGSQVIPLSARLSRQIREIYQRNSMTGYCLLLSYRATDCTISNELFSKFFEVPLAREGTYNENILVRSLSSEAVKVDDTKIETSEQLIENILSGHTLCGLVAMQYEALPTAVQLVDGLENNAVRFVYFSRENELRSRVFAEKLGLEAGWNCHISLAEPSNEKETSKPLQEAFLSTFGVQNDWEPISLKQKLLSKSESYLIEEPENRKSPCRRQSSVVSVKVGAMPNKAQLPTGVSHVRPHLEEVDNVPLLVGLFTDCDPVVNKEMLTIMQENGEVVLTIGSSLNMNNVSIFLQSDVSVCIPPLSDPNCSFLYKPPGIMTANDIAARILSTSADFELNHSQLLNISTTVTGSRNRLASIKTSLIFLAMASTQLSLLLLFSAIATLPLIFTTTQVFLTVFLQLPLLFLGLVWTPFQPKVAVIRIAQKGEKVTVWPYLVIFLIEFLPSILVLLVTFFISLADNATMLCSYSDVVCSFGEDIKLSTEEIRHIVGLHFIVYLITMSMSWVYSLSLFCWLPSILSPPWLLASTISLILQISYSYLSGVYLHRLISWPSLLLVVTWTVILFMINEICKMRRIRTFLREQRRTKLAFDTKLGMNSPY